MRTKQQLFRYSAIIFMMVVLACQSNKEKEKSKLSYEDIIRECVLKLQADEPEIKFIVSPKFGDFEFNSFMRKYYADKTDIDLRKKQTLDSLSWSERDFLNIQSDINKKFSGKYDYHLTKLSNTKLSNFVVSFSGVNENLVFAEITYYCNAVKPADLNREFYNEKKRFMSVDCINFLIKNDKVQIINGNGISLEYQCKDSDIHVD